MPVLNFTKEEVVTLLGALRTEIKDWDGRIQGSAPRKVDWIKRNIGECLALRARLQDAACSTSQDESLDAVEKPVDAQITEAEAKRRTAIAKMIIAEIQVGEALHSGSIGPFLGGYPAEGMIWHHNHGWLHPKKYIEAAQADIEAGEITREEVADALGIDVAELDAAPGYSFVGDIEEYAPDSNPFEITDADEPVTAGIDTQKASDGKVRIDITVGGRTLTVDGHESLLEALSNLNRRSL